MKLALLGDSTLDNAAYVSGGSDVATHLGEILPTGAEVELLARDGSRVESVFAQLAHVRPGATHLVVSAGGNDALDSIDLLDRPVASVGEALDHLAAAADCFRRSYRRMLRAAASDDRRVAACTIYDPAFEVPSFQSRAVAALAHFNDVIVFEAALAGLPILDLRRVCTEPAHYANPIEPSDAGGRRIAEAIARLLDAHRFESGTCRIYA